MNKSLFKKQIPTILALLILFIGAGAGVVLVGSGAGFLPRAGPEYAPKQVKITNVSDRSFSVSWVTDQNTSGFIRYGTTESLGTTVADDRDQLSGQTGNYQVHHVTVRGLSPNTNYFFKIGSGPSTNLYDSSGSAYTVTTGATLGAPVDSETAYGKVVNAAQTPADGAIVYVTIDGATPLSTLVKSSGSWAIPLSSIRSQNLSSFYSYDKSGDIINIEVLGPSGQATTGISDTQNDQPVPTITLGESFDFTSGTSAPDTKTTTKPPPPITQSPEASGSSGFSTAPLGGPDEKSPDAQVTLFNPSIEGEKINTTQPEFQGAAPANTRIFIKVESPETFEGELITDSTGSFEWTPPADLEPGNHSITVSYIDTNGIEQFFKRHFVVLAQGESNLPSLTSSPSATPTPTATPIPTPTPLPTTTPTPTPASTGSGRVSQPSTQSGVPVSGVATHGLYLTLSGIIFIGTGLVISRKLTI